MRVSVVVPVFNEEDNVPVLAAELHKVATCLDGFEIVLVDDGSSDSTWSRIEEAGRTYSEIKGMRLERNSGQSAAMLAGLRSASGDVLVTMDGDLQNNPADIPRLVAAIADADVVCGYRADRRDSWSRRVGSRLANFVRNRVTGDGLRDTGCSLKAFKKCCVGDLPPFRGMHRFMAAYFKLNGRRIVEVAVDHRPREHGLSKYTNLGRLPATVFDLVGFVWYRSRYQSAPVARPG